MTESSASAHEPLHVETVSNSETTRIQIHGAADVSNVTQLDAALTGIQLDGTKLVQIDVSDLAFFDVATLRCLTTFARTVKQTGRDITTRGATPLLQDVAGVLKIQEELGLH